MSDMFSESRARLAVELLREKGHVIDGSYISALGAIRIYIDGAVHTQPEAVRLASQYPEWLDKESQHLQALRAYQRSL
jgi:hypothetical protein